MKWFLLGAISFYQSLPARLRPQCLFRETCSSYVRRVTRESGVLAGLRALKTRVSQCRPGYVVFFDNEFKCWRVRFANGAVSNSPHVADFVLEPYIHASLRPWAADEVTAHINDESDLTVITPFSAAR